MSELIHNFGLDWKLLLTQVVNFFILLFVLKKFAYRPILKMLRQRKNDIEEGIRMSQKAKENLEKAEEIKQEKIEEARKEGLGIITKAEETGKQKKEEIVREANRKVEGIIAEAKRIISEDKARLEQEVEKEAEKIVRLALEKTLQKMPSEKDNLLIKEALRELKSESR